MEWMGAPSEFLLWPEAGDQELGRIFAGGEFTATRKFIDLSLGYAGNYRNKVQITRSRVIWYVDNLVAATLGRMLST